MKRNTPDAYYAAYSWSKMDNEQRREIVKLFEKDYGADFAHRADFGNQYNKPAVGPGKLLSKKRNLTGLDYYLDKLLETMVTIRSLVPVDFRLPTVRKGAASSARFGVYMVNPANGKSFAEALFDAKDAAERHKAEMDRLLDLSRVGGFREVRPAESRAETYDVFVYDYEKREYVPHPDFPKHDSLEKAVGRASHEARVNIAFFVQWPVWKSAGHKAPEDYDYFEKENVLRIQKKDFLLSPACENYDLEKTPYWKKLADPEVDQGFLDFCAAL